MSEWTFRIREGLWQLVSTSLSFSSFLFQDGNGNQLQERTLNEVTPTSSFLSNLLIPRSQRPKPLLHQYLLGSPCHSSPVFGVGTTYGQVLKCDVRLRDTDWLVSGVIQRVTKATRSRKSKQTFLKPDNEEKGCKNRRKVHESDEKPQTQQQLYCWLHVHLCCSRRILITGHSDISVWWRTRTLGVTGL